MSNAVPLPGNQLPVEAAQAVAAAAPPRPYANRVCVVIADGTIPAESVRRWLGDLLPIHVAPWTDRAYYTAIRRLRPRLIVVLEATAELAWDSGSLIANLFGRFEPTVLSAIEPGASNASGEPGPRLTLHLLGLRTEARLTSWGDLTLG